MNSQTTEKENRRSSQLYTIGRSALVCFMNNKILYIGNPDTAFIFQKIVEQANAELIVFSAITASKDMIINKALEEPYEMIVLNAPECYEVKSETINIIEKIFCSVNSHNTKIALMAPGYSSNSHLIVAAAQKGIRFFITGNTASDMIEEFKTAKAGIGNIPIDVYQIQNPAIKEEFISAAEKFSSVEIAVGGSMPRIGTTTIAIQLIKFLQSEGKTACYVDLSNTDYMDLVTNYYDTEKHENDLNKFTLVGVDIYTKVTQEILYQIHVRNYNFIIYDTGSLLNNSINTADFLRKSIKLLCVGNKPNENKALKSVANTLYNTKINYVYSFVPDDEIDDIREELEKWFGSACYFASYIPDAFSLNNSSRTMFKAILSEYFPVEVHEEIPQKLSFLERRKEKRKKKALQKAGATAHDSYAASASNESDKTDTPFT